VNNLSIPTAGLALFLGGLFAMMLSGFGPLAARLSVGSVGGALLAAVVVSWLGGALLQRRWLAAILFAVPMAVGLSLAAISQQWWRCLVLSACIAVPFVVVGQLRFDRRKFHHRGA
jgi:hypothetical protein